MMMLSTIQQQTAPNFDAATTTTRIPHPAASEDSRTSRNNHSSSSNYETNSNNILTATNNCAMAGRCISNCAAYGHVCPHAVRSAGLMAQRKVGMLIEKSVLFHDGIPNFTTVNKSQIIMGSQLGSGGFSNVNACCIRNQALDESMAIKSLKREVCVRQKSFENGAADLAIEACFLARLDHPNIVRLRAVTSSSVGGAAIKEQQGSNAADDPGSNAFVDINEETDESGFFIVVDRLVETLHERIVRWQVTADQIPTNLFYRLSREYRESQRSLLIERLQVAVDIASVMEYLHSMKVLFRDLKPDNIGFDKHGTLKLFDFGLAKEQKPSDKYEDGTYKMTGRTGSRRYMAPEVAKGEPYEKSVDVYSFGILLWEMCALEKPFAGYSSRKHYQQIVMGGERPKMDNSHTSHWPTSLQNLMKSCWSSDSNTRPAFSTIKEILQDVIADLDLCGSNRSNKSVGSSSRSSAAAAAVVDGHHHAAAVAAGHNNNNKSITSHIKKPQLGWLRRARS